MNRFQTCLCYLLLLKLHAIYKPLLHLLNFFYLQLTSLYCFSNQVFCMKSKTFFVHNGWVNIFIHSTTLNSSFSCLSFNISCHKLPNFWYFIKRCRIVCKLWQHLHYSLLTIFRLYKNKQNPIFLVLIYTNNELCDFFSLV